jgi:H+-transporting ATPase
MAETFDGVSLGDLPNSVPISTPSAPANNATNNQEEIELANQTPRAEFEFAESGLTSERAAELALIHGPNALPEHVVSKFYLFVSQLWQPMPVMIWLAAIIEIAISNWTDMGILLFIQFANASIGYRVHCRFNCMLNSASLLTAPCVFAGTTR